MHLENIPIVITPVSSGLYIIYIYIYLGEERQKNIKRKGVVDDVIHHSYINGL